MLFVKILLQLYFILFLLLKKINIYYTPNCYYTVDMAFTSTTETC